VIASPCNGVCRLVDGLCAGCFRSRAEIATWGRMNEGERQAVLTQILLRKSAAAETGALAGSVKTDL
jgi:hypothetical protein